VIVQLIDAPQAKPGQICYEIDGKLYPKDVKVSDQEMVKLNIKDNAFHLGAELHHLAQSTTTLKQLLPHPKRSEPAADAPGSRSPHAARR
jgi:hypothetical protein